jgi:hypothetical protein
MLGGNEVEEEKRGEKEKECKFNNYILFIFKFFFTM